MKTKLLVCWLFLGMMACKDNEPSPVSVTRKVTGACTYSNPKRCNEFTKWAFNVVKPGMVEICNTNGGTWADAACSTNDRLKEYCVVTTKNGVYSTYFYPPNTKESAKSICTAASEGSFKE